MNTISARFIRWTGVWLALALAGCAPKGPIGRPNLPDIDKSSFPALAPPRALEAGVVVHENQVAGGKIWVYLPAKAAAPASLPCVLIAPAGSTLEFGMDLAEGDRVEHLPYVRAGFAVVAYSIAGAVPEGHDNDAVFYNGVKAFQGAEAGLTDGRRAFEFALARVPAVDPKRIYTAGHSSAATLSLLVAENEPRVAACVAYAPCSDVRKRLGDWHISSVEAKVPGFGDFIDRTSPINGADRLRCPLFLFHAKDDTNVRISESATFVDAVKKSNPNVTFVQAASGGHHDGMIREGIPKAIQWLQALPAK
jgi:dipeptidyl aminopeptidase/acylaminoacyl peptidase